MKNSDQHHITTIKELWEKQEFQLSIPVIDLQHLWLIWLLLELDEVVSRGQPEEIDSKFQTISPELIDYTINHFSLEEDLLKKFDFPEQREHKSQHKHFIRVVEHRINERKSGDVKASSFLVNFLRKWLYNHILTEDRKYGQYITRRKKNSEIYFKDILEKTKIISISQKQVELYSAITGFTDLHEISSENALLEVLKIWKIYRLNVNIPIIDMQHLWLVKMIVELEQKKKIGSASDREQAFMHSIKTAINYSKEHFILEEMIFEKFMPNILKTHSFQHRQFLEFISLRNEQNKQGLYAAISNLVADFKEWIVSHIAIDDRILKYIAKKNSDELKEFLSTEISEGRVNVNPEHLRFYNRIRKML